MNNHQNNFERPTTHSFWVASQGVVPIVGVDIPFDEPKAPDIEFETDKAPPEEIAESLWEAIRNRLHDGCR